MRSESDRKVGDCRDVPDLIRPRSSALTLSVRLLEETNNIVTLYCLHKTYILPCTGRTHDIGSKSLVGRLGHEVPTPSQDMTMDAARGNPPNHHDDDDERTIRQQDSGEMRDETLYIKHHHCPEDDAVVPVPPHICASQGKINSFLANVHGFPGEQPKGVPLNEIKNIHMPQQDRTTGPNSSALGQESPEDGDTSDDEVVVLLENQKAQSNPKVTEQHSDDDDDIEVVARPPWASIPEVIDLTGDVSGPFSSHGVRSKTNLSQRTPQQQQQQHSSNGDSKHPERRAGRSTAGGERRYVLHSAVPRKSTGSKNCQLLWQKNNFNATLSNEDAAREQERLFQESAARVRCRAKFQVTQKASSMSSRMVTFPHPIIDVQNKFPDHWTFVDTYARLGLPKDAPLQLVKMHYRTLARAYHPDKSGTDNTARRFQAIAEAYNSIINRG